MGAQVLLDARAQCLEAVFFGHLESVQNGIVHSGDNLTGADIDSFRALSELLA